MPPAENFRSQGTEHGLLSADERRDVRLQALRVVIEPLVRAMNQHADVNAAFT